MANFRGREPQAVWPSELTVKATLLHCDNGCLPNMLSLIKSELLTQRLWQQLHLSASNLCWASPVIMLSNAKPQVMTGAWRLCHAAVSLQVSAAYGRLD